MHKIISTDAFIQQNLSEIAFSPAFLSKSRYYGYTCLKDIFAVGEKRLLAAPDFDPDWFTELLDVLQEHRILYLLSAGNH